MRSLPVLGLILTGLIASGLVGLFSPLIRFSLCFLLVSFVTGEILRTRLGLPSPAGRLAGAFLLGLALHAIIAWICSLFDLSLSIYSAVMQGFLFALFLVATIRDRRGTPRQAAGEPIPTAVLIVALLVGASLVVSPPSPTPEGDGYDHIGYVRTIIIEDDLTPAGPLAPVVAHDGEVEKHDPRKGTFHPLLAALCRACNVDPADAWRWLPGLLAPVVVLAFWCFCRLILPSGAYAAAALVLFLMFQGGLARGFLATIAYGQHVTLIFYWVLLVTAVDYARTPTLRSLLAIAALLLGGALIHVSLLIHFGLAVVTLLFFRKAFGLVGHGVWKLALTSLLCATIVIAWKVATSYDPGNLMHLHPQGLLYVTERLYVPSPIEVIKKYGLLFVAGLALLPGLLFVRSHRRHAVMCIGLALPAVAVAANPWVVPLIYERVGYLVQRFLLNVPVFSVTVLLLGCLIGWARRGRVMARIVAVVVLLVWGKLFLVSFTAWAHDIRTLHPLRRAENGADRVAAWINDRVPPSSVVLSDPATSYWLSAQADVKVVTLLHQHGTPNDDHVFERLDDVRNTLSPYTTQIEAVAVMQKYAVDYVLLNGAGPESRAYMAEWHPRMAGMLKDKFWKLRAVFDLVYAQDGYLLYKVSSEEPREYTWFPTAPFIQPAPQGAVRCPQGAGGEPRVTSIHIEPAVALPGEKLKITIGYQRDREIDSLLPLLLHIRFEDREYFEHAASFPGNKFVRRYRERRDAEFRRFRFDRRPFGGLYTPKMWPLGLEVFETVEFRLPADLRETDYEIQFRLTHEALIPNFTLRDLLYNDDRYTGSPCGKLSIRRQVLR